MAHRQLLLSFDFKFSPVHGGELSVGKRKTARPIDPKRALHLVFRSSHVRDSLSFTRHRGRVLSILDAAKARFDIMVYRASLNSNHIHLVIRGRGRRSIQNFLRTFAGVVARAITGARHSREFGKFWDLPVWSRIIEWGKAFRLALSYVTQNTLEASGQISYRPRPLRRKPAPLPS